MHYWKIKWVEVNGVDQLSDPVTGYVSACDYAVSVFAIGGRSVSFISF